MSNESKKNWTPGLTMHVKGGSQMETYSQSHGVVSSDGKQLIAGCFSDVRGGEEQAAENAKRLSECWNFLADHPDLDKVEVVSKEEIAQLRQQRDELVDALSALCFRIEKTGESGSLASAKIALDKVNNS